MNQSGRMEKVREALAFEAFTVMDEEQWIVDAALAEVEEWEATRPAINVLVVANDELLARVQAAEADRDEWIKATADNGAEADRFKIELARRDAEFRHVKAEADRLKAALDELLQWAAAVAPADRNTEEVP